MSGDQHAVTALSIDVEDWFQVSNLAAVVPRETWGERELRVERNTDRMLELLDEADARSTCFVLGWVAERLPSLVRRIAEAGHEIGSHGFGHQPIPELSEREFHADVRRSKELLEELSGAPVRGYRAPSFSITDWSIPILQELGFAYDSSLYPTIAHDRYGKLSGATAGTPVIELRAGFHEVCISSLPVGPLPLPWGGGGYFRLLPYAVFRRGIKRIVRMERPYVFYIHPWEIDPGQPRVEGLSRLARLRHYAGLENAEARLRDLLTEFRWTRIDRLLAEASPVAC